MLRKENTVALLQSFDRSQKSALEKYLDSPYFNIDEKAKTWLKEWLHIENGPASDELLTAHIKKTKAIVLKIVQETCLEFLAQYQFDTFAAMKVNLNLEGIRKRNIDRLYKDTLSIIEKLPVTEFDQSSDFYYYRALIEKNIFELKTENEKKNAKVKIASELNMHKISENIDLYYILEIMKNALHDYAVHDIDILSDQLREDMMFCLQAADEFGDKYPTVRLYADFIKLLTQPKLNQEQWDAWQHLFRLHLHKIPETEQQILKNASVRLQKNLPNKKNKESRQ